MKVHYLQHVPFEGPGSISRWTDSHGFPLTSTRLYADETLPSLENIDFLIILDGPYIQTPEQIMSFRAEARFTNINKIMNRLLDFLAFPNKPAV